MEYTTLGPTGTSVSQLCLGTWRFGAKTDGQVEISKDQAYSILERAWELGINFIDTANIYGDPNGTSERWIGEWLDDHDRSELVIASKVYYPTSESHPNSGGLSRTTIKRQIEETLTRLDTSYLDIYYIHNWDDSTPISETLSTLSWLVETGKVQYLGISNVAAWQLVKALWKSDVGDYHPFSVAQPRYNAAFNDSVSEYLDVCEDQELAVCPYSPLEGGFLTGKYSQAEKPPEGSRADFHGWDVDYPDKYWRVLEAVQSVASETDATPAQVALRWLTEHERFTCVPVFGAQTIDQLEENVMANDIDFEDRHFDRIIDSWEDDRA